jgi:hypothetical protein
MTPPRISEIECPGCDRISWIIDSDFRAAYLSGGVDLGYRDRTYSCAGCGSTGSGWAVRRQTPPRFLLHIPNTYPMSYAAVEYWLSVMRAHFPGYPKLPVLEESFALRTPDGMVKRLWHQLTGG